METSALVSGQIVRVNENVTTVEAAQDSVEISLNSKGTAQFVVKCYRHTVEEASAAAQATFDALYAKFNSKTPTMP